MHSASLLMQAALAYGARGWLVVPLHSPTGDREQPCSCLNPACDSVGKHPRILAWQKNASRDEATIRQWWEMWPYANVGIATGKATGWFVLDVDGNEGEESLARLEAANSPLPETVEQITGSGSRHKLFLAEGGLSNAVGFAPGLDVRTDGGQIAVEPSLHERGEEYRWDAEHHPDDVAIARAPGWLLAAIRKGVGSVRSDRSVGSVGSVIGQQIPEGQRNATLASMAGSMRRRGAAPAEIEAALLVMNRDRCRPQLSEREVGQIARSMGRYAPSVNGAVPNETVTSVVNVVLSLANRDAEAPSELEPEAYYGLPGEIVLTLEPHTESHPAALLASFLIGAGVLVGRGPFIYRDGARHCVNEFACLVGMSAVGRKGTATRRTDELFRAVDTQYCEYNKHIFMSHESASSLWNRRSIDGLGSGEALIAATAEADAELDSGPEDRRRVVFEEEFARPLTVMRREGSILSQILRAGWDGASLASRTKGRLIEARSVHLGILGHITEDELKRHLVAAEMFNGFANRFLWFCTHRSKSLPFGGGKPPLAGFIQLLHRVLEHAQTAQEIDFDAQARQMWGEGGVYELLTDRPPGLLGSVTGRAEAHVTRLALFYAVMDMAPAITARHLLAALAIWDYNERSCAFLFGRSTGDEYADTLEELLSEAYPGGLTRTQIRDGFRRNAMPGRIPKALALLEREGRAQRRLIPQEKGRPTEIWSLAESVKGLRQNDINDKSPLQLARELID